MREGERQAPALVVRVMSFSYRKGYPADESGHGGGFVFDCRWMHNPGRYEEYKPLTGLDAPVREFLEREGEAPGFSEDCAGMVGKAVEKYLRRGFDFLSVGFGCTGGRHRSVYCAEAVAKIVKERWPEVIVVLEHREQGLARRL